MNKLLLLIASSTLAIMISTSPAQIRHMVNTGIPLATIIWLLPVILLFGMYYFYRNYPAATFHSENKKDDLKQAIDTNDIGTNGD